MSIARPPVAPVELYEAPQRDRLDWLFLIVVGLLPWLPRPTFDGPTAVLAPSAMMAFAILYALWGGRGRQLRRSADARTDHLIIALVVIVAAYALQVVIGGRFAEMEHLFSRVLFFIGILVTVEWLGQRSLTVRHVFTALFTGFAVLSVLIIYQSLTEQSIFGSVGAARTFGQTLPFARNTGVPRSYGELGIIATAVWAFWLTSRHRLHPLLRVVSGVLVVLATVIAQSRSMWVAFILVTISYFLLRKKHRVVMAHGLLLLALLAPIAIDLAIPLLESNPVTAAFLGERTTRRNVDQRLEAIDVAVDFLIQDPAQSLVGYGREAWFDEVEKEAGAKLGIHNNYLAHLVFLGVIVGSLSIYLLYVAPSWRLCSRLGESEAHLMVFLAALGSFVNLNFYEGWFSPTLAIVLGAMWFVAYSPGEGPLPVPGAAQRRAGGYEDVTSSIA